MAVMTLANGAPIFYETSATTTTPADAYAAWAAELGVSSTATLQALDDDDAGFAIDLASSLFAGGSTKALFSSEGAVGFYRATPVSTESSSYSISNISRMYGLGTRPTLLLSFHPAGDLKSFGAKLQRANGVTILFAQHSTYNNTSTYRYNVAIRIGVAGGIELVGQAVDQPVNLYLTELAESTTHSVLQQRLALAQTVGSITRMKVYAQMVSGLMAASTPLGAASALGGQDIVRQARIAATSPLQFAAGVAYVQPVAMGAATTPLGAVQAIARQPVHARMAASALLGSVQALAYQRPVAQGLASTPLGSVAAVLYHDFSGVPDVANASIFYACQLVDDGVVLATVPMSSWQATLRYGLNYYVQAVFPGIDSLTDTLLNLPIGTEFVIFRGARLPDGTSVLQEMVRAPCQTVRFDGGSWNKTCTVRGYMKSLIAPGETPQPGPRALKNVRTLSVDGGDRRIRCGVDWFLRPGQPVVVNGINAIAGNINYYVSATDEYMDVSGGVV